MYIYKCTLTTCTQQNNYNAAIIFSLYSGMKTASVEYNDNFIITISSVHIILFITEYLWEYSSNITDNRWQVEQKLSQVINVHFNTQWSLETKRTDVCQTHMSYLCDISGVTKIGLKTTLVSRWAVCSYCGNSRMEDYYVWHKQNNAMSQADRQLTAQVESVWFLKNEWEKIDKRSIRSREKWLHELTDGT